MHWCQLRSSWHCLPQRTVSKRARPSLEFTGDKSPEVLKVLASLRGLDCEASAGAQACSPPLSAGAALPGALFLSAGHCVNRGTVQSISSSNSSLAVLADGDAAPHKL